MQGAVYDHKRHKKVTVLRPGCGQSNVSAGQHDYLLYRHCNRTGAHELYSAEAHNVQSCQGQDSVPVWSTHTSLQTIHRRQNHISRLCGFGFRTVMALGEVTILLKHVISL